MQLMLNLVAEDNITDLLTTDWQPRSLQSTTLLKHFQVLTEVMTEMFLHCGLVVDERVIEVTNYQDFYKSLASSLNVGQHFHYSGDTIHHSDGIYVNLQTKALYRLYGGADMLRC